MVVGAYTDPANDGTAHRLRRIMRHPDYRAATLQNDICLVFLSSCNAPSRTANGQGISTIPIGTRAGARAYAWF